MRRFIPRFPANHERFKNNAEAVKNWAVAIAVLFGGLWAAYKFSALKSTEVANLNLEIARKEVYQEAILEIDITAQEVVWPTTGGTAISGYVSIKNIGTKTALLDFKSTDYPLIISRIEFDGPEGALNYHGTKGFHFSKDHKESTSGLVVRSADYDKLPFLIPVEKPGAYMITFLTRADKESAPLPKGFQERIDAITGDGQTGTSKPEDSGDKKEDPRLWAKDMIIIVDGKPDAEMAGP